MRFASGLSNKSSVNRSQLTKIKMLPQVVVCFSIIIVASASNVRLVDSDNHYNSLRGRVEVKINETWGQVCGYQFGSADVGVVCISLGHQRDGSLETGQHGVGNTSIIIGQVTCNGNEISILDCQYRNQTTCSGNIAAVDCSSSLSATGSVGLEAGIIAAIVICLVAIVGVFILLGACLWRNDFCVGGGTAA